MSLKNSNQRKERRPERAPREAQSRELFSFLGLLCKRVARSDDHICTFVLHAVLGVDVRAEVAGDEHRGTLLGDADIMYYEAVDGQLDRCAVADSGADVGQVHRDLTLDLAVGAAFLKVAVVHEVGPEPCQPLRERRGIGIRCQSFADGQDVNRLLCLEQVLCSKEYIRVARLLEVSGPHLFEDVFLLARITHQGECENKVA